MKAAILAAGVGKRMQPLTRTLPKPLIPVAGRPFLDHVLESLKKANLKEIILVVGHLKDQIIERYGDGSDYGIEISYVEQKDQRGTADAISCTEFDDSFLVINGDVYCKSGSLKKIAKNHENKEATVTIGAYRVKNASSYGVIRTENDKVIEITEKPRNTYNQLINAGIYVFEPDIYRAIEETPISKRNEKEITTSIKFLINEGRLVTFSELGSWTHIGKPWDLLTANERALKNIDSKRNGEVESGACIKNNVTIKEGAIVRSGAYIEGPVYIGEDSDIGPNCHIRPYTGIGKKVRIGNAVEVKNSIIMNGTHAAHHTYIGDSVIGRCCNFGAGTKIGNLRLDGENVTMTVKGNSVDTGRRKLGTVFGDEVQTGLNSMINPGVKIGPNSTVGPGVLLSKDLPPNSDILVKQGKERKR